MKGLSPMVSIILLIAFTVGIGGLLFVWFSDLSSTQTGTIGTSSEKSAQCGSSVIRIEQVRYAAAQAQSWTFVNVTVTLISGTESVGNFTGTSTYKGASNTSYFNQTVLSPGQSLTLGINTSSTSGEAPEIVSVRGLCQSSFAITASCKSGQSCMKAV